VSIYKYCYGKIGLSKTRIIFKKTYIIKTLRILYSDTSDATISKFRTSFHVGIAED
jgi:hypothetical protein